MQEEDDLDASDASMDLDTPLPRRRSTRRAAATGARAASSYSGRATRSRSKASGGPTKSGGVVAMEPPAPLAPRVSGALPPRPQHSDGMPSSSASRAEQPEPQTDSASSVHSSSSSASSSSSSSSSFDGNDNANHLIPALPSLRAQVLHALAQNACGSAVFFADALVTLSKSHPDDVYLLALAYARGGENRRAVRLLRRTGMLSLSKRPMAGVPYAAAARDPGNFELDDSSTSSQTGRGHSIPRATIDVRALLLAGQCLAACELWKECLELVHPGGMHPNNGAGAGFVDMDIDEFGEAGGGRGDEDVNDDDNETAQARRLERALCTLAKGGGSSAAAAAAAADARRSVDSDGSSTSSSGLNNNIIFRGIGSASQAVGGMGTRDEGASAAAAMYLLRGRAYEEVGNRERAIEWYKAALRADVACVEAFSRLIDNRMLTSKEEQELLPDLPWSYSREDQWLLLVYQSKILTYQGKPDEEDGRDGAEGSDASKHTRGSSSARKVSSSKKKKKPSSARTATPKSGGHSRNGNSSAPKTPSSQGGYGGGSPSSERSLKKRFSQVEGPCGMADNMDVVVSKAECCLLEHNPRRAYELSKWVHEKDPFNLRCASVHVSALVELGHKSELFYVAHNLVAAYPERAISWFSVGCYYYVTGQFERARRYFHKATTKEAQFAPAWLGFGNAYAAQDESDQAMAAYRTAMRLFPGSHLPYLCTGMEYLRTNNFQVRLHRTALRMDEKEWSS